MDAVSCASPPAELPVEMPTGTTSRFVLLLVPLAVLVLLAATPARNSDLWLHLAAGRDFVEEPGGFAKSPSLYTAAESGWINASWLVDVLFYSLFAAGAGFALMLGKTLIVAATGALMLWRCRLRDHPWLGFLLCSCGVVALGPWLMALRPVMVSYFFLALTLVCLERLPGPAATWRTGWPLLAVCAIWVN